MFTRWNFQAAHHRSRKLRHQRRRDIRHRQARLRLLRCEPLEGRLLLAAVTVDTNNDVLDGTTTDITTLLANRGADGLISLREAITAANNTSGADTIDFGDGSGSGGTNFMDGTPDTITLGGTELPTITGAVSITGPGTNLLTIDANHLSRIFNVDDGNNNNQVPVEIVAMTLTGGMASEGGAILSRESLTLRDSVLTENSASGLGGGISSQTFSGGTTTIQNCTISGNSAAGNAGGGILSQNFGGGTTTIQNCTVTGNSANSTTGQGGGIFLQTINSTATIQNSTISGNSARTGGGIWSGAYSGSTTTIQNSTISGNSASTTGGGLYSRNYQTTNLTSSIVAGNAAASSAPDIKSGLGTVTVTTSLIGDNTGSGLTEDQTGASGNFVGTSANPIDPKLGLLADNGGPTQTMALMADSPALNTGSNPAGLTSDQRGTPFLRDDGSGVDMGAYERQTVAGLSLVVDTNVDENDGDYSPGDLSLREAIGLANGSIGPDAITFGDGSASGGTNFLDGTPDTITLGGTELAITDSLTITGPSTADMLTINANGGSRVFNVDNIDPSIIDVELVAMTLTGGLVSGGFPNDAGGGIRSLESLTVRDSVITGNQGGNGGGMFVENGNGVTTTIQNTTLVGNTAYTGGGIMAQGSYLGTLVIQDSIVTGNTANYGAGINSYNHGTTTIENSLVVGNVAQFYGGGIYSRNVGMAPFIATTTIQNSTISGNVVTGLLGAGGGIYADTHADGMLTIQNSTLSGNSAYYGGGVWSRNGGTTTIQNSTLSYNIGDDGGGGIFSHTTNDGATTIENSTLSGNYDGYAGGGMYSVTDLGGTTTIRNSTLSGNAAASNGGGIQSRNYGATYLISSIVAENIAPTPDLNNGAGSVTVTFSLIGDNTGSGLAEDQTGASGNFVGTAANPISPMLDDLDYHGGPTETMALLPGSPALNTGANPAGLTSDQRGAPFFVRDDGNGIDMGAFEAQSLAIVVDTNSDVDNGDYSPGDLSLRESIGLANLNPGADTITFGDGSAVGGTNFLDGTPDTITLGGTELAITDSLTITGPSTADMLTIDADGSSRIFNIDDGDSEHNIDVELVAMTLTGGWAAGGGSPDNAGGAVWSRENLTIRESVVTGNFAYFGGGIASYLYNNGSTTIADSTLSGNTAYFGGAVYSYTASGSTTTIQGSMLSANVVNDNGGGIYAVNYGVLSIQDSMVSGNVADFLGGGIYARTESDGTTTIQDSTVSQNEAYYGGGIAATTNFNSAMTIQNSTVSGNTARSGGGVAAFSDYYGALHIQNSTISGNTASGSAASRGGGLASYTGSYGTTTIQNSTISGNYAYQNGGGIYTENYGSTTIQNSTISENTAFDGSGGGIYSYNDGDTTIESSIVAGNTASYAADLYDGTDSVAVSFSLIGDNTGTVLAEAQPPTPDGDGNFVGQPVSEGGEGIIDPRLGPLADNGGPTKTMALQYGSPAIDAGVDATGAGLDQRGVTRPFDVALITVAGSDGSDMGALELVGGSIHGQKFEDLNGNGQRDPDEPGLNGFVIELYDADGTELLISTATMDMELDGVPGIDPLTERGLYWFSDLVPGDYVIREQAPSGFVPTYPGSLGSTDYLVPLGENQVLGVAPAEADVVCGPGDHWIDACGTPVIDSFFDVFFSVATFEVQGDGSSPFGPFTETVFAAGNTQVARSEPRESDTVGHFDTIDTEIVEMELTGSSPLLGQLRLRAGTEAGLLPPTLGQFQEQAGDPGMVDSFFDIFFEIDTADGTLHNNVPLRVSAVIEQVIPYFVDFVGQNAVELFTESNDPTGISITQVTHTPIYGPDFGNTVPGSIHGFKFEDVDGDGVYNDAVDLPAAGVDFTLTGTDGLGNVMSVTETTDVNGEFWFTGLLPSVAGVGPATGYTVTEIVPAGFVATTPAVFTTDLLSRQELVAFEGQAMIPPDDPRVETVIGEPLIFGNTAPGSIHGFKFEDRNGNGVYDESFDVPASGVTFTLTGTDTQGNVINQSMSTGVTGEFWFTDLRPSVSGVGPATGYTVTETVPDGFVATTDTSYTTDLLSRQELVAFAGQAMIPVPGYVEVQKLLSSDGASLDYLGYAVAIDGEVAVVGAYHENSEQGAAYVYELQAGVWNETAKLTASDGATGDQFGWSVEISGDTIVIGAPHDDDVADNAGSAYVFVRPGTGWATTSSFTAKLTASDGVASDFLGWPVSISGSTIAIGAFGVNDKGDNAGAVYVYERPVAGWSTTSTFDTKLTASDGALNDNFSNVAIDGDTIVVGAPGDAGNQGSAYVFERQTGVWNESAKLTASDGVAGDIFGASVSIRGGTVVVGASGDADNGMATGAAYVFERPGTGWASTGNFTAKLTASDGGFLDNFGRSVSMSGDTIVVGAYGDDDVANGAGAAYVYLRPQTGWTTTSNFDDKLTASDGAATDVFGWSVSVSGENLVIAAYADDDNGNESGSAYVFSLVIDPRQEILVGDPLMFGNVEMDFGDAPDPTYPTLLASNGARHVVVPGFNLGATIDHEPDGQPNGTATGDDVNLLYPGVAFPLGDEDGVVFTSPLYPGNLATLIVTASAPGLLDAWIDFNNDGSWAAGEQIFASSPLMAGPNMLSYSVPTSAAAGAQTFARFRFSSPGGLMPEGVASDGEVEDYTVTVAIPIPDTIGVQHFNQFYLDASGNYAWDGTSGGDVSLFFGNVGDTPIAGDWDGDGFDQIGVHRGNQFYLDLNGNGVWNGTAGGDALFVFGNIGDTPIIGDWDGDGADNIGIHRDNQFYLDLNGNGVWNGATGGDVSFVFGNVGDVPIVGDWDGDGSDNIGIHRDNQFFLDLNGNGVWDRATGGDVSFVFGNVGDVPITGDWDGGGSDDIGVRRGDQFFLDLNGNGVWNGSAGGDISFTFGNVGDTPIIGDWVGDGSDSIGTHSGNQFLLDVNDNGVWDGTSGGDTSFVFGNVGDTPIAGDWDGDGFDQIGVRRGNLFYLDMTGDGVWDGTAGGDVSFAFGNVGDTPIIGDWDGDGSDNIGIHRGNQFLLDLNGNGAAGDDVSFAFGNVGDVPIAGDWDGDGSDSIGVQRGNRFYLDVNGNGVWDGDAGGDLSLVFGNVGDVPIAGDWDGDGSDDIGVQRSNKFYLDVNGNGVWDGDAGGDLAFIFGNVGDRPIVGYWAPPPAPMLLAEGGPAQVVSETVPLTSEALAPIVSQAAEMWSHVGLTLAQHQLLGRVQVQIADLPGAQLGEARGSIITLDATAAGYGWFVDATPGENEEFYWADHNRLVADDAGPARDRMDLLGVVLHELGHVLGYGDLDPASLGGEVMSALLAPGERHAVIDGIFGRDEWMDFD